MNETNDSMELENRIHDLSMLGDVNSAHEVYEEALKHNNVRGMSHASQMAANVISPNVPNLLLNATPQAFDYELAHYSESNRDKFESALEDSRGSLLDFYATSIDATREVINSKIQENKDLKEADEKVKRESLELSVYESLAQLFGSMELNPEFKEDEDLVRAYNSYKDFVNAGPEEASSKTAEAIIGMNGLSDNASNLMNDWSPYKGRVRSIYGRMLAKSLLNENLELDKEKFDKAFGTLNNYAKIASMYESRKAKMTAEESKGE